LRPGTVIVARKGEGGELVAQLWLENPNETLLGKNLRYNEMILLKRMLEKIVAQRRAVLKTMI
jgi:hypothetical protein